MYHKMILGCKHTGVKRIRIHDFRHSHAAWLCSHHISPLLIQRRFGWKSIDILFNVYGHLLPDDENTLMDTLQQAGKKDENEEK